MSENEQSSTRSDAADSETVSVTEAARRLRVSVRTVQRRLDKGELQAVQEGDTRRVLLRDSERDTTRQTGRHATRHNATFDATRDIMSSDSDTTQRDTNTVSRSNEDDTARHDNATGRQHVARHDATTNATRDTTEGDRLRDIEAILSLEKDARIADLREVIESQKLQIEAANRQAAEATAALREYLKLQAKALPSGTPSGDTLKHIETETSTRNDAVSSRDVGAQAAQTGATGKVLATPKSGARGEGLRELRAILRKLWGR